MLIGYARVSTADQTLDLQLDALRAAGVLEDHLHHDIASGKRDSRPGLDVCLRTLREGDTLVVWKMDRLGRSLQHLVNLLAELGRKGVGLRILTGLGEGIDPSTPTGRLVFGVIGAIAEFERELIVERTNAGLKAARARGRRGGRKHKMTVEKLRIAKTAMADPETKVAGLCRQLGISRATLYRYVTPIGEATEAGQALLVAGARL